ncbi:Iron-regulated ABC transporter permease protein SufD [Paramicrobacterium humi]|uniref:Iron-regulated ABC transporter permease protein SufD n=1 Tax=Paramicrobacterium humi TaxID=640635 RepID=A0A1H4R147_9MICO|nr:Fe-S cluster assembly protein SufD [Microbacterium humi]SEC25546.1 Iron-regulated ABC transporter permease protein SufD [Microbacterium humi]
MTVTDTAATPAEAGQHGFKKHSDGGWDLVPVQTRSERFHSTNVADFPQLTGREAAWRYTPVARLTALSDGELDGGPYEISTTDAAGVSAEWLDVAEANRGQAGKPEERPSANAWTQTEKVYAITITGEEAKTVTVDRSALGATARAAHTVITAKPNSQAMLILKNTGDALLTENVEIVVEEGAQLTVVSVQWWDDSAMHLASHFARVSRDARLKHVVVTLGGDIVRVNPSVHLAEQGSDIESLGLYFADAGQHLEHQVYIHHDAPYSRSRVTYKGALQGEGAHTVWIGDVLIGPKATGTDSYEQNRNLVLTDGTRADSVPNLEIETGDIAGAGHASATGRFDDEQLFYLEARGIPEDEARRLVVRGFLTEIIQQIGDAELQEHLERAVEQELSGTVLTGDAQ